MIAAATDLQDPSHLSARVSSCDLSEELEAHCRFECLRSLIEFTHVAKFDRMIAFRRRQTLQVRACYKFFVEITDILGLRAGLPSDHGGDLRPRPIARASTASDMNGERLSRTAAWRSVYLPPALQIKARGMH